MQTSFGVAQVCPTTAHAPHMRSDVAVPCVVAHSPAPHDVIAVQAGGPAEYVLAGHEGPHVAAPVNEKVPGAQALQAVPPALAVPAAQGEQAAADVLCAGLDVPIGQALHSAALIAL